MIDYVALFGAIKAQSNREYDQSDHWERPCLLWPGPTNGQGEGWLRWRGESHNCTRAAWRYAFGETDGGREIAHACGRTACVEPSHLLLKLDSGEWIGGALA